MHIIGLGEVGGMVWVADELIELMDWVWLRGSNGLGLVCCCVGLVGWVKLL